MKHTSLSPSPEKNIYRIRGHAVILDSDLAFLYGVTPKRLNEQIKRNASRFPDDFMFQLTSSEWNSLRSQIATSNQRGGRRYLPYVFTEHGSLMAANVLNSPPPQAISMSLSLVRAFVKLRRLALSVESLARKVSDLEKGFAGHGKKFQIVFDALRQLMTVPTPPQTKNRLHHRPRPTWLRDLSRIKTDLSLRVTKPKRRRMCETCLSLASSFNLHSCPPTAKRRLIPQALLQHCSLAPLMP